MNGDGTDFYDGSPTYNIKGLRYWSAFGGAPGGNNIFMAAWATSNSVSGNPRTTAAQSDGTHFMGHHGAIFGLRKDEWLAEEMELHESAVDTSDGTYKRSVNGVANTHAPSTSTTNFISRTTARPNFL